MPILEGGIMRKLLLSAAVLAMTSSAFAGIILDSRYDYQTINSNSQASSNYSGESFFAFNYLRATFNSKIADNLDFDARLNFLAFAPTLASGAQGAMDNGNNNPAKAAGQNGVNYVAPGNVGNGTFGHSGLLIGSPAVTGPNDTIDFAQVTQKINDSWSFTAGKLKDDGLGGFESQVKSLDMYFTSLGYLGNKDMVGAQVTWKITDSQSLDLYYYNNDSQTDDTRPGANLRYRGAFGSFNVIANYSQIGEGQTITNTLSKVDANKNYGNVGVTYDWNDLKFTADYDFYTNATGADLPQGLSTNGNNRTLSDIVLDARYAWGQWTPDLKFETFQRTGYQTVSTGNDVTDNGINWSVGVEYKKNTTDAFRYHLAYVNGTTTYGNNSSYAGATNSTVNGQFAFLGIRYVGDFLK
jgi:hypothetical protein